MRPPWALIALACFLLSQTGMAQAGAGPAAQPQQPGATSVSSENPGSEVLSLTFSEALERGLKYNVGILTVREDERAAQALRLRSLSALLPHLTLGVSESIQQRNLKAFGFQGFPGISSVVGPFGLVDTRAYLSQTVLDLGAMRKARAGNENLEAARQSYQDTRDTVVLLVSNLYLQTVAEAARVQSTQAQLNTASAVYDQAISLKEAGLVPGIEVLRAKVELQAQQQRLIHFRNEFEKQKLSLARAIGLPLEQQYRLASQIPYTPPPPMTLEEARDRAYSLRADYRTVQALVRAAELQKRAAQSERLPTVVANADYGVNGPSIGESHGTFSVAVGVRIPVFQGGKVRADVLEADAALQKRKVELDDLRGRIDYELRAAFLDLKATQEQVEVSKSAATLASQQLEQARDRFGAGVANNIEVVQAQQAVATAEESYISSLYTFNLAKASLARAVGSAETTAKEFIGAQ